MDVTVVAVAADSRFRSPAERAIALRHQPMTGLRDSG
jgi:hypothetical protein